MTEDKRMPCRKALPPTSFAVPTQVSAGRLRCVVAFEDANGAPPCAILVPVALAGQRWCLADPQGQPIPQPNAAHLVARAEPLPAPGQDFPPTVEIDLPWPQSAAPFAMLLLFFDQIEGIGDGDFGLRRVEQFNPGRARLASADVPVGDPCTDPGVAFAQVRRALQRLPLAALGHGTVPSPVAATPALPSLARATAAAAAAPDWAAGFCLASCQYPAGMLDGAGRNQPWDLDASDLGPAGQSLWRLAQRLRSQPELAFTLLAGDQVYVDASAGLFDAAKLLDRFSFAYARMAEHPGMNRLNTANRPVLPLMDDHEAVDNWEPMPATAPGQAANAALLAEGKARYLSRQRRMWPAPSSPPPLPLPGAALFEQRRLGGFDFFLADTRSDRGLRDIGNWRDAQIIGPAQRGALQAWIGGRRADSPPAFVVSGAMVLPRRLGLADQPSLALQLDEWFGYPASLHALLAWVYDAAAPVVFLSGDEHIPCVATVRLSCPSEPQKVVTLHSVHSSALYAPYPFANALADDFAGSESFDFSDPDSGRQFNCQLSSWFPDCGDGFAALFPQRQGDGAWDLQVEFDGQNGRRPRTFRL